MRLCADVAVAFVLAALVSCSWKSVATEVEDALARASTARFEAEGATADLERIRFYDVTVSQDRPRALVVAVVEADGRLRAREEARISYVGREAFAMERCAGRGWCPAGEQFPALRGVLAALPALEGALPHDAGAPVHVLAWQIRVERDRALVGADYEVAGSESRHLRARWDLVHDRDRWAPRSDEHPDRGP